VEFAQRLAALSFESLGYFVVEGLSIGVREADLLAVRFDQDGRISERLHVEVQVSATPKGVLRGKAGFGKSAENPLKSAAEFIEKKYYHPKVVAAIKLRLGSDQYRRVFVHGRLKDKSQLSVFAKKKIEYIPIGKLVSDAFDANPVSELKRTVQVAELLKILEA